MRDKQTGMTGEQKERQRAVADGGEMRAGALGRDRKRERTKEREKERGKMH